jgi:arginyl-tRNA synthetase
LIKTIQVRIEQYLKEHKLTELDFTVERPKKREFGHLSTNLALKLAPKLRQNPYQIATDLAQNLFQNLNYIEKIEVIRPGFINIFLEAAYFQALVEEVLEKGGDFQKPIPEKKEKIQVEFVSANPTGPLTIGHGRQAVLGDTVARIFEWFGHDVTREYYFNDAGRQMRLLGLSVYARYMNLLGYEAELPADGYQGDYIIDIAKIIVDKWGEKYLNQPDNPYFTDFAAEQVFTLIQNTLDRLNIRHDVYYNEKDLYASGKIREVLKLLEEKNYTYQYDGAIWFKATLFGAEKDRVLVKSSGEPTYRLPDIAYHREKLLRGFARVIDLFGADHHATFPDVIAALKAMDLDTSPIQALIHQFVTLTRDGEKVKMSTRKATFVTLDELIDLVGADVARYFYLMRSADSHLNFDISLAQKESDENPVFYLQYAHARMHNILVHSREKGIDDFLDADCSLLVEDEILEVLDIISEFGEMMETASRTLDPIHLINYLQKLAGAFHRFYAKHRVVSEDQALSKARLKFILAVKTAIANAMQILGIQTPNVM